jgi:spoIIIJ-associated protein
MNAAERRIIHFALQDYPGITTFSEGEDPERCVIISPVKE